MKRLLIIAAFVAAGCSSTRQREHIPPANDILEPIARAENHLVTSLHAVSNLNTTVSARRAQLREIGGSNVVNQVDDKVMRAERDLEYLRAIENTIRLIEFRQQKLNEENNLLKQEYGF